jgi:hypothetical protein
MAGLRTPRWRAGGRRASATLLAVGLAVTALLSACGQSNSPGADASDFAKRAKSVAAAWRSSGAIAAWRNGLVPLGDLTQVISFDDSDLKDAFAQGRIGLQGTLDDTKASGVVTFPDGTTMPVALVGAHTAYTGLAVPQGRPCASNERCAGLVVTGATLGTTTLLTNRGQATVPAWRFSVAGLTQPLVRVAIDPASIDPASMTAPPAPSFDSRPTNLGVEVAQLIGVSGNEIRYQLWIGACETEPRPLVHEEADIIVLGGVVTPPPPNSTCTSQAIAAPVAATTATPVGDRPIVDAITGQAVTRKYPVG